MEPTLLLVYILIFFSVIIGPLMIIALYKSIRILSKLEEVIGYIDHIRELLEAWEMIPFNFIKKLMTYWSK